MSEQKTFKVTEEVELKAPKWDAHLGSLAVYKVTGGAAVRILDHESQIPAHWPDDLKRHCRAEILRHRELAENEYRYPGEACIWQFRIHNGEQQWRSSDREDWRVPFGGFKPSGLGFMAIDQVRAAARAWLEANKPENQWKPVEGAEDWELLQVYEGGSNEATVRKNGGYSVTFPAETLRTLPREHFRYEGHPGTIPEPVILACCKLLGVERVRPCPSCKGTGRVEVYSGATCSVGACPGCVKPLGENEFIDPCGDRHGLRWHEGGPEWFADYGWRPWNGFGVRGYEAGDAWFRANCPIDRFVTDDGRVLEFRLDDDGEAEALSESLRVVTSAAMPTGDRPLIRALYAFRDFERAKWEFTGNPTATISVFRKGHYRGYWDNDGASPQLRSQPTWVRTQAETMWKERNPEWSVRWNATGGWCGNGGAVEILKNGKCVASYFATPSLFPDRCPLDTQAEAVRVWDENNPKGKAKEKVVFKANGFKLVRSIDEPDALQLIDPQINQSEVEKFHSFPRRALKITIEPLGDE